MKPVPQKEKKPFKYFINHQIRAESVRLIDETGTNIGVVSFKEALERAKSFSLDLVQIAFFRDEPPTCKIVDYSKFKFELSKKEKEAKKKQRENAVKVKELKLRPGTDDNDLKTKARQALTWLEEGCRIKISILFRGRELSHQDIARETLNKLLEMTPGMCLDGHPVLAGKLLSVMASKGKL